MKAPVTLKIKFKSASLEQFIERYSVDVSRGGIFIRTKEPLGTGTPLKFEFQLQNGAMLLSGDGTVVWIRENDPQKVTPGQAPGMGVRFDRLSPESQPTLDKILDEKKKRGEVLSESRFETGQRASATASGQVVAATVVPNKTVPHNEFGGGDSKSQTPLPPPMPGFEANADEFQEESTRVMQDEMVQALAASRSEEHTSELQSQR